MRAPLATAVGLMCAAFAAAAADFRIALIGDLGYSETAFPVAHEREFAAVLSELAAEPLAFVIHDGDLGDPREVCRDDFLRQRFQQLNALPHPVIYTPGDNEWTDCGASQRLVRLERIRQVFFAEARSLGQRRIELERQADVDPAFPEFVENVRWHMGEVLFATLHMVGSSSNVRTPEHQRRDLANIEWLRGTFVLAQQQSRALMLITQTNPFGADAFVNAGITEAFRSALLQGVMDLGLPVALVHGDTHTFRVDHPLIGPNGSRLANFTRVETFGTPDHHWVEVTIDLADPAVFTFAPRYVEANR